MEKKINFFKEKYQISLQINTFDTIYQILMLIKIHHKCFYEVRLKMFINLSLFFHKNVHTLKILIR